MFNIFKGLLFGLAYVAPIGIQNLYVINNALNRPLKRAMIISTIVIFFDISLSLACFYGIGGLFSVWPFLKTAILLIGGLLVLWIGFKLIKNTVSLQPNQDSSKDQDNYFKAIIAAFSIAWLNPQAILDGTLLLGAFKATLSPSDGTWFILGVMIASLIWFSGLTLVMEIIKGKIKVKWLIWLNRLCGAILMLYGIHLIWSFLIIVI